MDNVKDKFGKKVISLESGNGGFEMDEFLKSFTKNFHRGNKWENFSNDSATYKLPNGDILCFTTDSFVVDPIEFAGGDIGHLAICGTINDLVVMGAKPIGLSLAFIIEEGFDVEVFNRIINSINLVSKKYDVPIVTGDTKVMQRGAVDKIVINVSGVGICKKIIDEKISVGDKIIISGGIAEHGVALLSKRFDFETTIVSDSKALIDEMNDVSSLCLFAKDPTRGGIASILNEIAKEKKFELEIDECKIPIKSEVKKACELLGIDPYSLANEGKVLIIASEKNSELIVKKLKKYNLMAAVIGEVKKKDDSGIVILKTQYSSRILSMPSGKIVPRIC